MGRAVNQTVAWIAAFFLSLMVFGAGLAIVLNLRPQHRDDHDDHEMAADHEADESEHHGAAASEHSTGKEEQTSHSKPKIEHEDPHAKDGEDEEKEITPASVKAGEEEHVPEAKPHH